MRTRTFLAIIFISVFFFISNLNTFSQTKGNLEVRDAETAIVKLRELYKKRDFESGYELGQKFIAKFPNNLELKAWFILNQARNEMSSEAIAEAEKLIAENKENAWSWFALANAYMRDLQKEKALSAAEKTLEIEADDEEFIFTYANVLFMHQRFDDIYEWLDKNESKVTDKSRLYTTKGEAYYRHSLLQNAEKEYGKGYQEKFLNLSFKNFEKGRSLSPNDVNANYIYGVQLNYAKRYEEALPILRKAVELSPNVAHIRQKYWQAILYGQPKKNEQQKKNEVIADIKKMMWLHPDSVNVLVEISSFYGNELEMPGEKEAIEKMILNKFSQTPQAERILIWRIRRFDANGEDGKVDEQKQNQRVKMLKDFIDRPKHFNENYLGETYANLFFYVEDDKKVTNAELLRIAEETGKYPQLSIDGTYSMIARAFADRKIFREAERFAVEGFKKVKAEIEKQRTNGGDETELKRSLDTMNAILHDSLGWIYYRENRLDEAVKEIEKAITLNENNTKFYNNLGQVYEAKNELEKAEDLYIKAFSRYYGKDNPNEEALKNLYKKRNGNLDGFEAYFEKVKEIERSLRKERILSKKIKDPKNATAFNLKNLKGELLPFENLKGKVVVVNIWGTWCVPCVREMPEFQELHKKYQNDKDIAILTINNDESLDIINKFMNEKKYDFTVLRDETYLDQVGINSFPTTWFIDREGKMSFIEIGSTDKLLEEFSWRIEELKRVEN